MPYDIAFFFLFLKFLVTYVTLKYFVYYLVSYLEYHFSTKHFVDTFIYFAISLLVLVSLFLPLQRLIWS
jgi:hypothetical protein